MFPVFSNTSCGDLPLGLACVDNTCSSEPMAGYYYLMITFGRTDRCQLAFGLNTPDPTMHLRRFDGVWGGWKTIPLS